jgi:soluble lytic murein transglycosylase-like protein
MLLRHLACAVCLVLALGASARAQEAASAPAPQEPATSAPPAAPPPPATAGNAPARTDLRVIVRTEAAKTGMPPELADAVATVESNYNTGAVGDVGEIGLMQILPSTARMLGFYGTAAELATPATNARYGVQYLSQAWRQAGGDICTTVMKYRAGHGETRFSQKSVAYCRRVRQILAAQGYPVKGEVPVATFGSAEGAVGTAGPRRAGRGGPRKARSRIDWASHDRRIREIEARMSGGGIMR